mgnify:CR=1 FL=1
MSSYRPSYRRNAWPDREAEKREAARKAEEEIRKKNEMNETNFPSLTTVHRVAQPAGNQYASLAQKWAVDDQVDRRIAEHKKFQEATERNERERMAERYAHRRSRYERHEQEDDEEELAPEPRSAGNSMFEDESGWSEVKHKAYKSKRELTVEEMDERDRLQQQEETEEFNAHLFESNRHDHDRV